jgi:hypothetical protein
MLSSTLHTFRRVLALTRREPRESGMPAQGPQLPGNLIFRMKSWPRLPEAGRTAEIYRVLSVMSSQPVNRQWLLARCTMAPRELDELLLQLVRDGALEVIDPSRFEGREPCRA